MKVNLYTYRFVSLLVNNLFFYNKTVSFPSAGVCLFPNQISIYPCLSIFKMFKYTAVMSTIIEQNVNNHHFYY